MVILNRKGLYVDGTTVRAELLNQLRRTGSVIIVAGT